MEKSSFYLLFMCFSFIMLNYQRAFGAESRWYLWVVTSLEVLMGAALGIFDPSTCAQMYVEAFH